MSFMQIASGHKIIREYLCFECGKIISIEEYISPGTLVPEYWPPAGWKYVHGRLFCPKHHLQLKIINGDGERTINID